MSSINKRKHKTLTLREKMDIIKRLDMGENMCKLAKEYNVGRATLYDIKKKKIKIIDHIDSMENEPGIRKTLKVGVYPKMETALYTWFLQERRKQKPISGEILKLKAVEFYKKMTKQGDFLASDGWLDKFKRRFGIRLLSISKENLSSVMSADSTVQPFVQLVQEKITKLALTPDQVYNAAESGLFWKILPKKSFVSSQEASEPERKMNKERITFMPCFNASGKHKFNLMVIGKSKNPKAFKNVRLPVFYMNQSKAWVTREVFTQWFQKEFVPGVRKFMRTYNLPEKALLILDNAPSRPNAKELVSSDGMIQTVFLPPNCTPLLQPLDQNIIQMIKARYKKKLLIDVITQDGDISQCHENLNLKNAVFSLAQSWNSVSVSTIRSSWRKLWPAMTVSTEEEWDKEDDLPVAALLKAFAERNFDIKEEDLTSYLNENAEETEQLMTDEEICNAVVTEVSPGLEEVESYQSERRIKNDEVLQSFTKCIIWAEENGVSAQDNMILRNLREKVFKQGLVEKKTKSIVEKTLI